VLFTRNGWQVRPLLCYDLRFPVLSRDAQDTDLLLYTSNWPAPGVCSEIICCLRGQLKTSAIWQ
jgi:predicted amidohydrolase